MNVAEVRGAARGPSLMDDHPGWLWVQEGELLFWGLPEERRPPPSSLPLASLAEALRRGIHTINKLFMYFVRTHSDLKKTFSDLYLLHPMWVFPCTKNRKPV